MNILLFGKNGQVGWELQRSLAPLGKLQAPDTRSTEYCGDLNNMSGLHDTVEKLAPDVIVNAAAYTAVDRAEQETTQARRINAEAVGVLATAAAAQGALFVHYSTDYVFDGGGSRPWRETDATNPINAYGASKAEGEKAVIASGCRHLIFRTSWVYASRRENFLKTMLKLACERESLNVIDDQHGAPTGAELIADITAHAIAATSDNPAYTGIYHLAAAGKTSWFDYARVTIKTARQLGMAIRVTDKHINAISTVEYPTPATRPLNSLLNTEKLRTTFGLELPEWESGVKRAVTEIVKS